MGSLNIALLRNYAYKANIAYSTYDFIPMDNGMAITTTVPEISTTATTTTTQVITSLAEKVL